jgi:Xaa-Pro aminopeptidase
MDYAAISDLTKLQELLPNVRFESADMLLARVRSMKTSRELDWIRKAVAASEAGYLEMQKEIRAGIPFRELNNIWTSTVLKHDALPVYATPISRMAPGRGQYKQPDSVLVRGPELVEEGLVYRVEYSVVAGSYFSDQKFNFYVGTPIKESYATWQEHHDRQIFMEDFIRPGMSKREVFAACQAEFANVEEYMWWIHGVGMEVHEEPQLGSLLPHSLAVKPEITFEENKVSALESSWLVEDIYVLKADGFQGWAPCRKRWRYFERVCERKPVRPEHFGRLSAGSVEGLGGQCAEK